MSTATAVINSLYYFCTDFMIHSANLLGWTYVDTNSVLLLIVFPLTSCLLGATALWQRRVLRRLREERGPSEQQTATTEPRGAPVNRGTGMGFLRLALIAVGLWPACLAVAMPIVMLSGAVEPEDLALYGVMALATLAAISIPWGLGRWRGAGFRATKLPWFFGFSAVMFISGCVLSFFTILITGLFLEESPSLRQPVTGAKCIDEMKDEIPKAWKARVDSCESLDRSAFQYRYEYWRGTASVDKAICRDLVDRVRKTKVGEAKDFCRWDDPAGWARVRCSKLKMKGMKRCLQCKYMGKTHDEYSLYVGVTKACSRAMIFSGVNADPSVLTEL